MLLSPSTSLGRYHILSRLGAGGMGEVYLAHDAQLNRNVAIKILPAELASDSERMPRFIQEAKTISALNHPNILTIHEIGQAEGTSFIVTEHIDGVTLREHMQSKRVKLHEVLDIAAQIAAALDAAHEAKIVHRDIKPENIMLRRRDLIVKVLDFGLAKPTESTEGQRPDQAVDTEVGTQVLVHTEPGRLMGTVAYMSPEQSQGSSLTDLRTDIWSLGVVLYEMVAGQRPFEGKDIHRQIISIQESKPLTLSRFAEGVPNRLEEIVEKALAKDPDERYQTAKDFLIDLRNLKRRLEVDAEIERSVPPDLRNTASGARGGITHSQPATNTIPVEQAHPTSSAEYIVNEIKHHKRGAALVLAMLLVAFAGLVYFFYFAQSGKATINSVAVLPFINVSNDANTEYLSDGISESLINSLSQLPQLKVIARSSTFRYKGKEVDLQDVAKALNVRAIVTGRIIQRGDTMQISVEMTDASDKTQMWGDQYNRKATDLLAVQSEISSTIAERLRLRLTTNEQQQLARRATTNPQAYELLLKGNFYARQGSTENQKKAVQYYNQAIVVDPTYAQAYAELSVRYSNLAENSILDPKEFIPKAEAAARKALELDDTLAQAHLALANLKTDAWDWATVEREYQRANVLNPNLAGTGYANYLSCTGRHEQALVEIKRVRERNPVSLTANVMVGFIFYMARRYDDAIEALKNTLELDKNYDGAYLYLGYVYAAKEMYADAIASYQQAIKLGDESPSTQISLGSAYARAGEREKGQAILKSLQTSKEYKSPGELAQIYAALGDWEEAFASLEKAYAGHDLQLQYLGVDPAFDSIRSDPRFTDLIRRVGLTP